jgi:ankyrin repeat protein
VRYGAALHLHDKRLQTPLHFAAETGSFESLKIILKIAALLDSPEDCRMVIRDLAAAEDFLSADDEGNSHAGFACKELIEAKDYKGRSALHFAVRTNQVRHAELLIKYGADVDSPDSVLGRTPLFIAIYWNHHCMIRLLLRSQARLDMADDGAMTVLHYTAKFGDSETIRILSLENFQGISPNCRDRQGQTPRDIFENVRPSVMAEGEAVAAVSRKYFEQILNGLVVINR